MIETIYGVCALIGGTLLACQFLFGLVGLGDHHDAVGDHDLHDAGGHDSAGDHEGQHSAFLGVLTFRGVTAALTFFGLTGLAASINWQLEPELTLGLALLGGAAALFGIAYLMRMLHHLKSDGTARIERAIGLSGTVYLVVPGHKSGKGKVSLRLQNRTVEYQAVTPHQQLATGSAVVVTAVLAPDTIEVEAVDRLAATP